MHCANCGGQVNPGQIFCSRCGQELGNASNFSRAGQVAPPPQPAIQQGVTDASTGSKDQSRVARNLSTLGALWILYSILRLIPGIALMAIGRLHFPFLFTPFPFLSHFPAWPFLGFLGMAVSIISFAGVLAGWGLLAHQPWARVLAIILAIVNVIHFPLGTALAVYTFWVLLANGAEAEYQRLAQVH